MWCVDWLRRPVESGHSKRKIQFPGIYVRYLAVRGFNNTLAQTAGFDGGLN